MKRVYCSYEKCGVRRRHFEEPFTERGTQTISVPDDHKGPMFCSFECAIYAGGMTLTGDGKGKVDPASLSDAIEL
jgi:hypothetical protein